MVDLLAEIIQVPSALIMKVEVPNIKVLVASESKGNPWEANEVAPLNGGTYCETVMETHQLLLVPDALQDDGWKSNPDIALGMISYLGLPISWPDGEIFGTICVLDRKKNEYSEVYRKLIRHCRDVSQAHLRTLVAVHAERERCEATIRRLFDVAQEVKQPIAATVSNAQAALRSLNCQPPDLDEVRQALGDIIKDSNRTGEVIGRILELSNGAPVRKDRLDINEAIEREID
jgi:GAF domain-containing protein